MIFNPGLTISPEVIVPAGKAVRVSISGGPVMVDVDKLTGNGWFCVAQLGTSNGTARIADQNAVSVVRYRVYADSVSVAEIAFEFI
jgi:hypothetical protein